MGSQRSRCVASLCSYSTYSLRRLQRPRQFCDSPSAPRCPNESTQERAVATVRSSALPWRSWKSPIESTAERTLTLDSDSKVKTWPPIPIEMWRGHLQTVATARTRPWSESYECINFFGFWLQMAFIWVWRASGRLAAPWPRSHGTLRALDRRTSDPWPVILF